MYLEYGVTLDHTKHSAERIEQFHRIGAEQVRNIPECDALIVPSGSCNSLTSVLYGLALYKPSIKKLILIEIGPSRRKWVYERMAVIQNSMEGLKTDVLGVFDKYPIEYHDLHGSKYVTYQDTMDYTHADIEFHPRYEGKVMTYISRRQPSLLNEDNLFWIIGAKSKIEKMEEFMK